MERNYKINILKTVTIKLLLNKGTRVLWNVAKKLTQTARENKRGNNRFRQLQKCGDNIKINLRRTERAVWN
jgi:hypothetical protein